MDYCRLRTEVRWREWCKLQLYGLMFAHRNAKLTNKTDSEEQKKEFAEKPDDYLQYRKRVEEEINMNWGAVCAKIQMM